MYFIQSGYFEITPWWIPIFQHYLEWNDDTGHTLVAGPTPLVGLTYTYKIWFDGYGSHKWWNYIQLGDLIVVPIRLVDVVYYIPVDLQAFVETESTQTNIDGSHLSNLRGWDRYNEQWFLWYQHTPFTTPGSPYYLTEESHWEFYAYGGSL
ncbi:hypothetical protein LCGC14_0838930 [marine sediment metagenome]|uniref:Uncharacterized protein n=1 Tax=marine sediment metagenome TaxID=412755 RepID=A0A0F9PIE0_9ZZZZ